MIAPACTPLEKCQYYHENDKRMRKFSSLFLLERQVLLPHC